MGIESGTKEGKEETKRRLILALRDGSIMEMVRNDKLDSFEEQILIGIIDSHADYMKQTDRPPEQFRNNLIACKILMDELWGAVETPPDNALAGKIKEPKD